AAAAVPEVNHVLETASRPAFFSSLLRANCRARPCRAASAVIPAVPGTARVVGHAKWRIDPKALVGTGLVVSRACAAYGRLRRFRFGSGRTGGANAFLTAPRRAADGSADRSGAARVATRARPRDPAT
ncbi:hypothetical protein, partial [Halovulum marinum]|uniref:hypothetical protein n=1 Tax=Halovulum marinum TaxID=2662447 RepID=UPI001F224F6C